MAEEAKEQVAEVIAKGAGVDPKKKLLILLGLAVVIIAAAAGAGGMIAHKASAAAAQAPAAEVAEEPPAATTEPAKSDTQYAYPELEPIIVNLDEPRLARYIRASIVLAVRSENKTAVEELIGKKKPELKSWLTVYLAGCTLEDVRGPKNLNRIRREIQESFNEQLWPGGKPLIEKVLFKEFAVQ